MSDSSKERFVLTKAYEVAYALFRLATPMKEKDFAEQLRSAGAALLAGTASGDYDSASSSLRVMECLVKFGGDVNLIGTPNADVLLREIYALDAAIVDQKKEIKTDEVNVAEIFSKPEIAAHAAPKEEPAIRQTEKVEDPTIYQATDFKPVTVAVKSVAEETANNISGILKSAIRQTAILERIRQSGNCRLKDIQEILPEASERTIRYDLQTLLEQNLIERIGNAGPSVFYRATQMADR